MSGFRLRDRKERAIPAPERRDRPWANSSHPEAYRQSVRAWWKCAKIAFEAEEKTRVSLTAISHRFMRTGTATQLRNERKAKKKETNCSLLSLVLFS